MKPCITFAATLAGALALVVAACGGGEATATPRSPATSQPTVAPVPSPSPTAVPAQAPTPTPQPSPTPAPQPTRTPSGPEPRSGGVLQVRIFSDFRPWDTWQVAGAFSYPSTKAMMSNLVQYRQGTFEIRGDLAESWEVSPDAKSLVFRLRRDAQWHDGKPVTAKDIAYSLQRGSDPQYNQNRARVAPIQSLDTLDDYTLRITLKDVSNAFLPQLASVFMLMYPAHLSDIPQWQKAPVGSGPFKFAVDNPNVAYEFTKNPTYFGKDAQGRRLPYLDGIRFNVIVDAALALSSFVTGRLDCGCALAELWVLQNEERVRREVPGVKLVNHGGTVVQLYFNTKRPPFDNTAFRQGVAIGLDRETIGAAFNLGKNVFPTPPLLPPEMGGQWGLPREELNKLPGYGRDRAGDVRTAKQKLQESGLDPAKFKVEVLSPMVTVTDVADLVATLLKRDLGLDTTVSAVSTPEMNQRRIAGNFQLNIFNEGGSIDDPLDWYAEFITTGGSRNWGGYSNPRADQLLRDQDKELDQAKRKQQVWELQRIELTEFPRAAILWPLQGRATRAEVMNFRVGPMNLQNYDWSDIWLDRRG